VTNRFICIHGHFYQPPRENAWLEEIEIQDSAAPYHDWNERVSAECYAPNSSSRILDDEDRIIDIVNNYASISFDAGPTLLAWMEKSSPEVYRAVLDADKESRARFRGHGVAMAQAFNHLIMPLAGSRDKRTQVIWGIRDFEHRFGRRPEGMWLPETAVDLESLDVMAEFGILFAVLAPDQASQVKDLKGGEWRDVSGGCIDPKMPYLCRLPSGRTIALFFYDGPISHDVAFGGLLKNGERFAKKLMSAFSGADGQRGKGEPEIVHIATDGETYGHHHRFGDMALAYALHYLEKNKLAEVTVYGDYLERFPPAAEVKICEKTSWSCGHGVERWRSDCGDSTGANPGWNQKWRAPLRQAMDWLAAKAAAVYEKEMAAFSQDPWRVRDDYIRVILDRSQDAVEAFIAGQAGAALSAPDKTRFLKLLEMERHAMLIFTSDGWFFDDISNVETVQVIQYAARAMQLLRDVSGIELEPEYVRMLEKARSNVPEHKNGAVVYETLVKPAVVDFLRLGAHFAVSSLFETYPQAVKIAHYSADSDVCEHKESGQRKLALGKVRLKSNVTWEERTVDYAVLHLGDQNITAGVREHDGDTRYSDMCRSIGGAFGKGDMTSVVRLIDQHFGTHSYALWHLFKEERRKILFKILGASLRGLEADFRQIFESNYAVMQGMKEMQIPLPEALSTPAEYVLNVDLRRLMEGPDVDVEKLRKLAEEYKTWSFKPDGEAVSYIVSRKVGALMASWAKKPEDTAGLKKIEGVLSILKRMDIGLDLWESQNIYFSTGKALYGKAAAKETQGQKAASEWAKAFRSLGELLRVDPSAFLPSKPV
jgi:alpha-amylase/alpha-mannosidase (GH57 family)